MDILSIAANTAAEMKELSKELMTTRAVQIIITCLVAMFMAQVLKVIIFSIRDKKFEIKMFFTTGGLPSSHSSLCVCLCVILGMLQFHDENRLTWAFAVAVVLSSVVLYDAMGVRLEASKHAKILNRLSDELSEEEKEEFYGKKGKLKEMLGHRGIEVLVGALLGAGVGFAGFGIVMMIS